MLIFSKIFEVIQTIYLYISSNLFYNRYNRKNFHSNHSAMHKNFVEDFIANKNVTIQMSECTTFIKNISFGKEIQ